MAPRLPDNPSLEHLRKEARTLQRAVRAAAPEAIGQVSTHHPRPDRVLGETSEFTLSDAQVTVARGYGFEGWPALVRHVETATALTVDPTQLPATMDAADTFCSFACLRYDDEDAPPRWAHAAALLEADPDLVHGHVWAAAAAGDVDVIETLLRGDPGLADRRGGPFGWVPLLYLTYSRVPLEVSAESSTRIATALLDAGADPNAGYLWRGLPSPFTALTGLFGEGEQGAGRDPRHPHWKPLATLLLERGADVADHQTLYNRMFEPDDSHLDLLFDHGLATAELGHWERLLGPAIETREQMWSRQVHWAADHGFGDRLDLLTAHGIDTSGVTLVPRAGADDLVDVDAVDENGATALHRAAWSGDVDEVRALLEAGASTDITDARFGSTALGWAEHAYQDDAAALLREWMTGATTPTE